MKIAHINCIPLKETSPCSLKPKIVAQANAAKELGLDIDFIILNNRFEQEENNIKLIKSKTPIGGMHLRGCATYALRNIDYGINLSKYDRIILRYPAPLAVDFHCGAFLKKYRNKIITEHHTNEISELRVRFPDTYLSRIRLMLEKISASIILSSIKGIIAVTDEIREIELRKTIMKKPSVTITNGIDVNNIQFTKFKPFDGKTLNIIFVCSMFFKWHGLERLLDGLVRYRGHIKINLYLIGVLCDHRYVDKCRDSCPSNVDIHKLGSQYGAELDRCFSESTVAVSTLGLFKNEMKQACPLKTREYFARGIPFIYAYDDPDIENPCDYALQFDNNNSLIEIEKIIKFAKRTADIERLSQSMREYALRRLDWKIKVKKMYGFAQNI
jgi:glycosyltransferase involved in cell wall biosynthesis